MVEGVDPSTPDGQCVGARGGGGRDWYLYLYTYTYRYRQVYIVITFIPFVHLFVRSFFYFISALFRFSFSFVGFHFVSFYLISSVFFEELEWQDT